MDRELWAKDLSGERFGNWIVISRDQEEKSQPYWNCQCKCGNYKKVSGGSLRKGKSKQCKSCATKNAPRPDGLKGINNLLGKSFGKWTVIAQSESRYGGRAYWNCKCECGIEKEVSGQSLIDGRSTQCTKCSPRDGGLKHGGCSGGKIPEYHIWNSMKNRCHNLNDKGYPNYGGRGITVCKKWIESFEEFYSYIGQQPFPGASIDRIDNNGNYEPGNVRWATRKQQAANTRRQKHGVCVSQWSKEKNLDRFHVAKALKNGLTLEQVEKKVLKEFVEY